MRKLYILLIALFAITISHAQIVNIPDANFKNALVDTNCVDTDGDGFGDSDVDLNDDGEIQESEAEVILWLNVETEDIVSLEGIQSFINLKYLDCFRNDITNLDVTQNPNLEVLNCAENSMSNLDVSRNPNLRILFCRASQLVNLDVSQNPNLEYLNCTSNFLTNLDVSNNTMLTRLYSIQNQLTSLKINNGNNINIEQLFVWNNLDLTCIQVDDVNYANSRDCNIDGWCKDEWVSYSEDCVLGVEDFQRNNIAVFPNPVQDILNIESPQQIESVEIYNLQGQLIKEDSSRSIDVSYLNAGLYFVQVTADGMTETKKFIKSK
jgi:hypothetical protein